MWLVRHYARNDDPVRSLAMLRILVKTDPLDEEARELLVQALVHQANYAEAMREVRAYEAALRDELCVTSPSRLRKYLASQPR
jgi:DNA-binding SARP family transcriptional activator